MEIYAKMSEYIPWNLVNIHVDSRINGIDVHRKILAEEVAKLSEKAKSLVSLENDEKSYSFEDTLLIAEENGLMMVPDFHHERCFQKRKLDNGLGLSIENHIKCNKEIDQTIYNNLDRVFATYDGKLASPTFHISSPINGWNGNFKDYCVHSNYIDLLDYPSKLLEFSEKLKIDVRLDIEAKAKQDAIFRLENRS